MKKKQLEAIHEPIDRLDIRAIDEAIDRMDIEEIEKRLEPLLEENPFKDSMEDSKLFAKRIIKQNQKGRSVMKLNRRNKIVLVASLAVVIGGSVFATGVINQYTIHKADKTIEIKTAGSLSEEEVQQIADDMANSYGKDKPEENVLYGEDLKKEFGTIEEAEKALNMKLVMPSYIPEEFKLAGDIYCEYFSEDKNNTYITYASAQDANKLLGVTVIKEVLPEDSTMVTVNDSVYEGEYTSSSGDKYTLYKDTGEKPEQVAHIAKIIIGDVEYAVVSAGMDEAEFHKIIDSVNLDAYRK